MIASLIGARLTASPALYRPSCVEKAFSICEAEPTAETNALLSPTLTVKPCDCRCEVTAAMSSAVGPYLAANSVVREELP